jgi:hypothetical protein
LDFEKLGGAMKCGGEVWTSNALQKIVHTAAAGAAGRKYCNGDIDSKYFNTPSFDCWILRFLTAVAAY